MRPSRTQALVHVLGAVALFLVAVLAYELREARAGALILDDEARAALPATAAGHGALVPTHLIDDPDAAYHLRRAQVALVTGEVPSEDRFLNHPAGGSAVPWPPLFDGMLSFYGRLSQGRPGSMGLTNSYEAELEGRLVHLPPLLGALTTLAIALAAGAFTYRGRPGLYLRRGFTIAPTVAGLLAGLAYATLPIAAWYGDVGRIDHHVAIALIFALHHLAFARIFACGSFESDDSHCELRGLDATFGGITAGFLAGIALLIWLASALFVAVAGLSFYLACAGRRPERSDDARWAGALYFLTATIVTLPAALASPWNETQAGSVINLTLGVPMALFAAALALWLPGQLGVWMGRGPAGALRGIPGRTMASRSWRQRLACLGLVPLFGAIAVAILPGFLGGLREGFAWASRGNLFMDVVDESRPLIEVGQGSLLRGVIADLGLVGVALPFLVLGLVLIVQRSLDGRRGQLRAEARLHLLLNLVVFATLAASQRRFGNSLAVPLAVSAGVVPGLVIGRIEEGLLAGLWRKVVALGGLALAGVVLVAGLQQGRALGAPDGPTLDDTRAWRAEVLTGLRWMRTGTPVPGPWTMAMAEQDYGVLSGWGMGHLIEYHARRPVVATNFGSFVGPESFPAAAAALVERDPARFLEQLAELDAEYVVVTPRIVGDLASNARIAGLAGPARQALFTKLDGKKTFSKVAAETMAWRLAVTGPGGEPSAVPGLERVYASRRKESIFGGIKAGPVGPVISIWRRVE